MPTNAFSRGLSVSEKNEIILQHEKYGIAAGKATRNLGLNSSKVWNFLGHAERKNRLTTSERSEWKSVNYLAIPGFKGKGCIDVITAWNYHV